MIDPLELCIGLSAECSSVSRRVWISFNFNDLSILDMNQEPTPSVIHPSAVRFDNHRAFTGCFDAF